MKRRAKARRWAEAAGPRRLRVIVSILATILASPALPSATSAAETTLFAFGTYFEASGSYPAGTLLRGPDGALYGATMASGEFNAGTIFRLAPPAPGSTRWTLSVLHTFTNGSDGLRPNADLVRGPDGALYGTTAGDAARSQGTIFKLAPPLPGRTRWTHTVLYYFRYNWANDIRDGAIPHGGVIMDGNGVLYGTTCLGGSTADPSGAGFGTVFSLSPPPPGKTRWVERVLYRFAGGADGACPQAALALGGNGALYGTTLWGGQWSCRDYLVYPVSCGTVFRLLPPTPGQTRWRKTTLHRFTGARDGGKPYGQLLLRSGALHGTAYQGGTGPCTDAFSNVVGCGVVFRLTPPAPGQTRWTHATLVNFAGPNGAFPEGGVSADRSGNLYGTTGRGGRYGSGVAFKLSPPAAGQTRWTYRLLHSFNISASGDRPVGELVGDAAAARLFGVTNLGGPKLGGTVFEIRP